jgi:translation initiation factor IF-2
MKENDKLLPRPPIVVVMGHIDHGKTTLLDYIRKSNVAAKEAGGITQSIGAYEIFHNDKKITFIDTPGHEAFSKMRARGSRAADLAILVVAADEGVKLQTQEAISHIQAAKIPFMVALNKIDKPNINLEKVKNELTGAGVLLEGYGGNVSWQAVSAKTGEGISELLDLILLAAELENLKYNPQRPGRGIILEARLDNRRGIVASAIVKDGVLKTGQEIATPTARGKIKLLENFLGKKVNSLEPSAPALILGFNALPQIGEEFLTGKTEVKLSAVQTDESPEKINPVRNLPISNGVKFILKAENAGELEALSGVIKNIPSEKPLVILSRGVGKINENDLKLAIDSQALIIGFRTNLDRSAENLSRLSPVKVITSDVIYDLVKKIEEYLVLATDAKISGELEVLAVFGSPGKGKQIIGGRITRGVIKNQQIFTQGRILNIQEQRKDVAEAAAGKEVGLLVETDDIIKVGDILKFNELSKPAGS